MTCDVRHATLISLRLYLLHGESLTEPSSRTWMFYDWTKVNRSGIAFRLASIFLEDLPQLAIQSAAAANSGEMLSPLALASIVLTAMCVAALCQWCSYR